MPLPINLEDVLNGRTVEWERLEFKKGWNPEKILHSLCAFANDFHNLGGGYIIIGIEEKNGRPVLPPNGLSADSIDKIQKEIIQLGHRLQPFYHPIVAPYEIEGKIVLVLWAGGGQTRPYKAPVSLSGECKEYAYYIRKGSVTAKAKQQEEVELIGMAATVPFDDRMNQMSGIDDLDLGLIRVFLQHIGSELYQDSTSMDFLQLCRQMNIVDGPDEMVHPKNIGLIFSMKVQTVFSRKPKLTLLNFQMVPEQTLLPKKSLKGLSTECLKTLLTI